MPEGATSRRQSPYRDSIRPNHTCHGKHFHKGPDPVGRLRACLQGVHTSPHGELEPAFGRLPMLQATILFIVSLLGAFTVSTPRHSQAQQFDDPPVIIESGDALSESQDDHVEAVALFAQGRVLLRHGLSLDGAPRAEQLAMALRRFQRAWWFEHRLISIMEDIAPLTFELERPAEATRYLIIAAEQQDVPIELLERVAAQLAEFDEFDEAQSERALKLYLKLEQRQGASGSAITQFQIGRLALTMGQYARAATAFTAVQKALEEKDSGGISARLRDQLTQHLETTYALFGESYLRAGQWDKAEAAFRRADKSKPEPAALAFRLALVEKGRGNKAKAIALLQQYFDAKAESAGLAPYVLLAELIDGPSPDSNASSTRASSEHPPTPSDKQAPSDGDAMQGAPHKPSKALLEKLEQLARADANNPLLGYYLADHLRRAEKWDAAEALYKKLLKQEPAADGYQGLVAIYRRQKRTAELLEQLAGVVSEVGSLEPLDDAPEAIAKETTLLDQLAQRTRELATNADQRPPDGAWLALALLNAKAQRNDQAMEFLAEGLKDPIATAGQAAVNLAFTMLQANQPKYAGNVFQRILDKKLVAERSAEVYFYLAGALTLASDYDLALAAARQAARLEPKSPRMLAREAWVLFQAKRLHEARARYLELLNQFDADHTTLENREVMRDIRLALSAVEVELKNTAAAEEWLQQTLDEFPTFIGAYNDLGYLWAEQGKHLRRSLSMVRKAVESEPDNIAYLDSLGWALYRLNRFTEAIEPLEKAAAEKNVDGVILDHLGDAYLKAKQPAKAIETWHKASAAFHEKKESALREAVELKIKQHSQP